MSRRSSCRGVRRARTLRHDAEGAAPDLLALLLDRLRFPSQFWCFPAVLGLKSETGISVAAGGHVRTPSLTPLHASPEIPERDRLRLGRRVAEASQRFPLTRARGIHGIRNEHGGAQVGAP
jgi:hypothetical protein